MEYSGVKWADPPPRARAGRQGFHKEMAEELRSRPGEWAVVLTYSLARTSSSMALTIRQGASAAWQPVGHFEAVARTVNGEHRVYARYVGGPDGDDV